MGRITLALLLAASIAAAPRAISPSAVLVYGDALEQPVLLRPASPGDFPAFQLLWGAYPYFSRAFVRIGENPADGRPGFASVRGRPYLNLAIFWGRYEPDRLKQEYASQHGRFYLPFESGAAVVVVTPPDMQEKANPIPQRLEEFSAGWTLTPGEMTTLRRLGVPGL